MLSRTQRQRPDGSRSTDIITLHFAGMLAADISGGAETTSALTTFEPPSNHQEEPLERAVRETTKGTRLPDEWVPPLGIMAGDFGLSHEQYADQVERFRDYWRAVPGAKGRKVDWPATWRNWLRTAAERRPANVRTDRHQPTTGRAARRGVWAEIIAEERSMGAGGTS